MVTCIQETYSLQKPICIFDAIEFNDRFRYSDVASDVAFLAMDLDFQRRNDLIRLFYRQIHRLL